MQRLKKSQIAKLVLITIAILVVFLLVVIVIQNIQIKMLEEQLKEMEPVLHFAVALR